LGRQSAPGARPDLPRGISPWASGSRSESPSRRATGYGAHRRQSPSSPVLSDDRLPAHFVWEQLDPDHRRIESNDSRASAPRAVRQGPSFAVSDDDPGTLETIPAAGDRRDGMTVPAAAGQGRGPAERAGRESADSAESWGYPAPSPEMGKS
jgi:hypothetical protein